MESRRTYSRTFKQKVLNEVISGKISKEGARYKYGIKGNSAILNWQRQFTQEQEEAMQKQEIQQMSQTELEARVRKLEKALSDERFKSRAYSIYVEELEKEINSEHGKKYVTGQLTESKKKAKAQ